jgi:putative ATP-dependent endonuclease of the OLD family
MYLSNIKLWNFRKFGSISSSIDLESPNLDLNFTNGLNVLIGENDSGKTAIIDAIKLVLKSHSYEWIRVSDEDFFNDSLRFRIELKFDDFSEKEASYFTEWLTYTGEGEDTKVYLRLIYDVQRNKERILPSDVKAGADEIGSSIDAEAREQLKVTYLKPLRDAESELVSKKYSRLSQIFKGHEAFKGKENNHHLMNISGQFNQSIELYFEGKKIDPINSTHQELSDKDGKALKCKIDEYIQAFCSGKQSKLVVAEGNLRSILEKLELSLKNEINLGLGTLNRLFMAAELLHLNKNNWDGIRLGLIEELESHLHPQSQMQVIERLQKEKNIQLILTTHSPNLASKVKLENLIICNESTAFPLGETYTKLESSDYIFLERFLDVTKANLFFAKGIIMVEGWSEEILIPALARKMKKDGILTKDLTDAGVSVVNVGSLAFLRYSRIFLRETEPEINVPVAVITDIDIPEYEKVNKDNVEVFELVNPILLATKKSEKLANLYRKYNHQKVKAFLAPYWTFEYSIFKSSSLSAKFQEITKSIHSKSNFNDFEKELATKLLNKRLEKTDIAYQLAQSIENDPAIIIHKNDESIKYLIEAIKYVCGN